VINQPGGYNNKNDAAYAPELIRQLSELRGVESVSLSRFFPMAINTAPLLQPVGRADLAGGAGEVGAPIEVVSPRFFETVGMTLIQGRDFTWKDDGHHSEVAIINASLSRHLFPTGGAIGRQIRIGIDRSRRSIEIIGIVSDASIGNVRDAHLPIVFRPWLQEPQATFVPVIVLRISGEPLNLVEPVRRVVASLGREYIFAISTLEDRLNRSLAQERVTAALASLFAAVAVLLAFVGLYGLLAYAVVRRTREIGVRMALGASRWIIARMIVGEGLALAVFGVVLGVPCAVAVGRLSGALLYGLMPSDPLTLASAAGFFFVLGAFSGLWPALRASTIDPMTALRCE
jgi:predicted permease